MEIEVKINLANETREGQLRKNGLVSSLGRNECCGFRL